MAKRLRCLVRRQSLDSLLAPLPAVPRRAQAARILLYTIAKIGLIPRRGSRLTSARIAAELARRAGGGDAMRPGPVADMKRPYLDPNPKAGSRSRGEPSGAGPGGVVRGPMRSNVRARPCIEPCTAEHIARDGDRRT